MKSTDHNGIIAHIAAASTIVGLVLYYYVPLGIVFGLYGLGAVLGGFALVSSILDRGKRLGLFGYIEAVFSLLPILIGITLIIMLQIAKTSG